MDRKSTLHDFAAGETGRGPGVPSSLTNNPRSGQWDGRRMSKRMIADYKTFIVHRRRRRTQFAVRLRLPVPLRRMLQLVDLGFPSRPRIHAEARRQDRRRPQGAVDPGITFLGGEPMLNTPVLLPLARRIRGEFGHDKDIWCWTGYTWEELMRPGETPDKLELLQLIDILVDGRYLKDQHDSLLQFRGSRNQRILDVPRSLAAGRPVVWAKLHDQERDIPEMYLKDREAGEGAQAS